MNIQPRFECPLKARRYILPKATIDLKKLDFVPFPGSTWIMSMKLLSVKGGKQLLAFCAIIEYKITEAKLKKRNRKERPR